MVHEVSLHRILVMKLLKREAIENINKKIVPTDGEKLAEYMIKYNLWISTDYVYKIKNIDSDYFEES